MKKLLIVLAFLFASQVHAVQVAKDWVKILDAGETAMVIPETGEVKLLWSSGQPLADGYIGLLLKNSNSDFAMFSSAPADVWARTNTINPVNLTVNKSTDVSKDD